MRAHDNAAVRAIVKQPACPAPINSSGLVADSPSSNRDLNEYGPPTAPLPTFSLPLPSARLPNHSASAFLLGINSYSPHSILATAATGSCSGSRRVRAGLASELSRVLSFPLVSSASQSRHKSNALRKCFVRSLTK